MSGIHSVQEPAWAPACEIAIEAGAKQPEAKARFVLDPEIIARWPAAVFAPPVTFDAFGAFRSHHFVPGAPPAEANRRTIRNERQEIIDRFGLGEQAQRAGAQLRFRAEAAKRVPAGLRRCRELRRQGLDNEFGNMTIPGEETRDMAASKPSAQAIDQAVELGFLLSAAETDLLLRTGLGDKDRQTREIETKTGVDILAQGGKPF